MEVYYFIVWKYDVSLFYHAVVKTRTNELPNKSEAVELCFTVSKKIHFP